MLIWLVDDNDEFLATTKRILKDEGSIINAQNIELVTIGKLRDFESSVRELDEPDCAIPSLIFLDLRFKIVREGYLALDLIKNHEKMDVRTIPIVMFSSSSEESEVRKSYRKSANVYVEKGSGPYGKFKSVVDDWTLQVRRL